MTKEYGSLPAQLFGDLNEIYGDPPMIDSQPLSQEEIDRIRLGNGIPKGGLL
jgi:hypothetical protein